MSRNKHYVLTGLVLAQLSFFQWSSAARATQMSIELSEETYTRTDKATSDGSPIYRTDWITTKYAFDTQTLKLRSAVRIFGENVPPITSYKVKGDDTHAYQLYFGDKALGPANEILYQCHVDQKDLVIVRNEYNSFFGPIRAVAALSGHPVQVSEIVIYVLQDGRVTHQARITKKDSSYHWRTTVRD